MRNFTKFQIFTIIGIIFVMFAVGVVVGQQNTGNVLLEAAQAPRATQYVAVPITFQKFIPVQTTVVIKEDRFVSLPFPTLVDTCPPPPEPTKIACPNGQNAAGCIATQACADGDPVGCQLWLFETVPTDLPSFF